MWRRTSGARLQAYVVLGFYYVYIDNTSNETLNSNVLAFKCWLSWSKEVKPHYFIYRNFLCIKIWEILAEETEITTSFSLINIHESTQSLL